MIDAHQNRNKKRRLPLRVLPLAAALLVGGCSLIPSYERPVAPTPTAFPGAAAAPGGVAASVTPWQTFFTDPRLTGLIETALANNRDLRVALQNVELAGAQYGVQRAALWPALSASLNGSRSSPNPARALNSSADSVATNYSVNLGWAAWEIDLFGRVRALGDVALARYLASEESHHAAQISLISAVASGWLNLLADEELLAITRQALATREDTLQLTQLRFDNGVASELDYQQARSLAEGARATYAQQQRLRRQDENALALLLGAPVPAQALAGAATGLASVQPLPEVPAGLPSALLNERPDVRAAEQSLIAANANIGAARAAFFPRVALTGSLGTASPEFSGLFDSGTRNWIFAPQISLPIFSGGALRANLQAAKASRDIALAQYEKSIQSAFREVADALAGRETLGEQARAQNATVAAETARFRLSELRYRSGVASSLDLLDSQRSLFAAQQQGVQVRLLELQNRILLYKALGGGWTRPSAAPT